MELGFAGVFAAGLLTFFTPCVLPLVPIYLAALAGGDLSRVHGFGRGQLLVRAGLFSLGFIAVFTLLGLTASGIGSFMIAHKEVLQVIGALLILVFGLKFVGLVKIPLMDRIVRADDTKLETRFGALNAFIMGVVFAAGWSPCVGPILGSVLTYTASQTADPLTGATFLGLYGLGFAVPLVVTAGFAQAGVGLLRRANQYLPFFEKAVGILLVIVAAGLLLDLARNHTDSEASATASQNDSVQFTLHENGEHLPVMVELYSSSCTICEQMKPIVDAISTQCHGQKVRVLTKDVSTPENQHLAKQFRLVGVPTFLFLDTEGQEVARLVGAQSEDSLKQALSALRGEPCPGLGTLPGQELEDRLSFPEQGGESYSCSSGFSSVEELEEAPCDAPEPPVL